MRLANSAHEPMVCMTRVRLSMRTWFEPDEADVNMINLLEPSVRKR